MKLKSVQITEFQSIRDTTPFDVSDITCLVGKNESGKTSILKALYRLNPIHADDGAFNVTDDYPRVDVQDYEFAVEKKKRQPANVIRATFQLDSRELEPIVAELGEAFTSGEFTLIKGYASKPNVYSFTLDADEEKGIDHLIANSGLHQTVLARLSDAKTAKAVLTVLKAEEQTEAVVTLCGTLEKIVMRGMDGYIHDKHIRGSVPKFVYFSEYYQMRGVENIQSLQARVAQGQLLESDHPMLGLIALARLKLVDLLNPQRTQELINRLEAAGNYLSKRMLTHWSQNRHLELKFDVRPALPQDPEGMREGTNVWASVYDSRHKVTTNLGSRSQGFVWFFSFLAWYSQLQSEGEPLILLLDEPGLSLHAKAQMDLLRYFDTELGPEHQLIYTTHSPFMVDAARWDRVRIVQDNGIDASGQLPLQEDGTKVITDVLKANSDSLFPLMGALGIELSQTLFVGPNCLIVEGVSDLLYLQTMSALLEQQGREGLSSQWTITPVGGADKVPAFAALIGAQTSLNLATLIDIDKEHEQSIEHLYKSRLLMKNQVLTYAQFTGTKYADVEDMLDVDCYLDLVNGEFKATLVQPIREVDLTSHPARVVTRLRAYFDQSPMSGGTRFNHFRPARFFAANSGRVAVPPATLDRFENAFKALNALLPKG